MNRKVGRLKLWQWLAIGGATGLVLYAYKKGKTSEEPKVAGGLAASVPNPTGGGGEGLAGGALQAPAAPGAPGEPGPPGPSGTPAAPAALSPEIEALPGQIAELNGRINSLNNGLPAATMKPAASGTRFPQVNPRTGEHYRTVHEHGKVVHEYHSGKKVVVSAAKASHKSANEKHQAKQHARQHAHPANPHHAEAHAGGGNVAPAQHGRPVPVQHRAAPKKPPPKKKRR